jgi:hypothetical protein
MESALEQVSDNLQIIEGIFGTSVGRCGEARPSLLCFTRRSPGWACGLEEGFAPAAPDLGGEIHRRARGQDAGGGAFFEQ